MTFDEVIGKVRKEFDRIERDYGIANRHHDVGRWVALLVRRIGHLAHAATVQDGPWMAEELVKLAATSLSWLCTQPISSLGGMGREGILEVDRVRTAYPRIVGKELEAPEDAVRVASDVGRVWIGNGGVWIDKTP